MKKLFLCLFCLFLSKSGLPNEGPCRQVQLGVSGEQYLSFLEDQRAFIKKALKLNPRLEVLDPFTLDILKSQKMILGVVGYSGGAAFNRQASEVVLRNLLRGLDPTRVILESGATNEGVPGLMYEIAKEMGFKTIGITSWKSGAYAPSFMDYVLTIGNDWGRESMFFLKSSDFITGIGGGNQSYQELVTARQMGIPIFPITNSRILGASSRVVGKKYGKGETAAQAISQAINNLPYYRWAIKLPNSIDHIQKEDLRSVYRDKQIIGFTGWSQPLGVNRDAHVEKFARELLSRADPAKHIIATGGSHLGAERVVHNVAVKMGFEVIGLVSHSIAKPETPVFDKLSAVVPIARSQQGRVYSLVNHIDALVSFGGGNVVTEQVKLAQQAGLPAAHMIGNVKESDSAISTGRFRSGTRAAQSILKGMR